MSEIYTGADPYTDSEKAVFGPMYAEITAHDLGVEREVGSTRASVDYLLLAGMCDRIGLGRCAAKLTDMSNNSIDRAQARRDNYLMYEGTFGYIKRSHEAEGRRLAAKNLYKAGFAELERPRGVSIREAISEPDYAIISHLEPSEYRKYMMVNLSSTLGYTTAPAFTVLELSESSGSVTKGVAVAGGVAVSSAVANVWNKYRVHRRYEVIGDSPMPDESIS